MSRLFPSKLCSLCKHRNRDIVTCAAYPDGIPDEIWDMEVDHREAYPGDNGITFEPKDDSPRTLLKLSMVRIRKRYRRRNRGTPIREVMNQKQLAELEALERKMKDGNAARQ